MKRLIWMIFVLLAVLLAACGSSDDAEAVYQKAVEAGEKVDSAEVDLQMTQTMEDDVTFGEMTTKMNMQAAVTMDPLAMHQKGTMEMEIQGVPIDTEIEMYMTESRIYMFESMSGTWLKMDGSMLPVELASMDQGPAEQLDILESFVDQVEFMEEDGVYVYKFAGEGDEINEFTQKLIEENFDEEMFGDLGMSELLNEITIHSLDYELHIDKETYDTKKVITNLDFEIPSNEGDPLRMKQEMTVDYIGINTIDVIEVPQDVIDAAEEI